MKTLAVSLWTTTLLLACAQAHALDITACGATVPDHETGTLQVDLDCSADPPSLHVVLGNRSSLDLNGHFIVASAGSKAVSCALSRGCTVRGPGDLSGGDAGISAARNLNVENVTIHDTRSGISSGDNGKLVITGVDVSNTEQGCITGGRVIANDVSVVDCGVYGIQAEGSLRGTTIVANDNGGSGVIAHSVYKISGLTAMNNGQTPLREGAGILAFRRGLLADSTLTGNNYTGPGFGPVAVDIMATTAPKLLNVTCDKSLQWTGPDQQGPTLGICAQD